MLRIASRLYESAVSAPDLWGEIADSANNQYKNHPVYRPCLQGFYCKPALLAKARTVNACCQGKNSQ